LLDTKIIQSPKFFYFSHFEQVFIEEYQQVLKHSKIS